jgi:hypothetical protein
MNVVLFLTLIPLPRTVEGRARRNGESMEPQNDRLQEQDQTQIVNLQEQFGAGLQDESLSAAQVLIQQEEAHTPNERAALYIP